MADTDLAKDGTKQGPKILTTRFIPDVVPEALHTFFWDTIVLPKILSCSARIISC
jgi:hypothetical protein